MKNYTINSASNIKTIVSAFALMTLSMCAFGQGKVVDLFTTKTDSVKVIFFDPLLALEKSTGFQKKSDKEKSDSFDIYLHNHPLYLFVVANFKTKDTTYLCIRGNPLKVNTKMFYKVDVIKGVADTAFDPSSNYSDKIVKVVDNMNCGGTLFEHMDMFMLPENKKYVGNGILFYSAYRRVTPYSEIKTSITSIIEQL